MRAMTSPLQVGTGRCRACGVKITWVPKPGGGYFRPMESLGSGFAVINDRLLDSQLLLKLHECDQQLIAEAEFRELAYREAIQSIDCPHPRCNGVKGGPCLSLLDGVTPLRSFHKERMRAVPRNCLPRPYGGKLG